MFLHTRFLPWIPHWAGQAWSAALTKQGQRQGRGGGTSGAGIFILAYVYSLDPFENYTVYVTFWYHFILGIGPGARLSRSKSLFHSCVALETVPRFPHL